MYVHRHECIAYVDALDKSAITDKVSKVVRVIGLACLWAVLNGCSGDAETWEQSADQTQTTPDIRLTEVNRSVQSTIEEIKTRLKSYDVNKAMNGRIFFHVLGLAQWWRLGSEGSGAAVTHESFQRNVRSLLFKLAELPGGWTFSSHKTEGDQLALQSSEKEVFLMDGFTYLRGNLLNPEQFKGGDITKPIIENLRVLDVPPIAPSATDVDYLMNGSPESCSK